MNLVIVLAGAVLACVHGLARAAEPLQTTNKPWRTSAEVAPMSKLYAGLLVIASMLALSAFGALGLVVITRLINFLP